jgi:hypothetical protein
MMMSLEFRNEAKYHEQGKKIVMREKMDLGIEDECSCPRLQGLFHASHGFQT